MSDTPVFKPVPFKNDRYNSYHKHKYNRVVGKWKNLNDDSAEASNYSRRSFTEEPWHKKSKRKYVQVYLLFCILRLAILLRLYLYMRMD